MAAADQPTTACLIIIGDEILSGRTRDANLAYLAKWLNDSGVRLAEARVVADVPDAIVRAVNECRAAYDYVFTTGGIGPTHDDITAEAIAAAFGVGIDHHPDAYRLLLDYYGEADFTEARQRMARVPDGGELIENPISLAPGFRIDNVFVLAGVPEIMRAMLESLRHRITGGRPVRSRSLVAHMPESQLAGELGQVQADHPAVQIGSYPFYRNGRPGVHVIIRAEDTDRIAAAAAAVKEAARQAGGEAVDTEFEG